MPHLYGHNEDRFRSTNKHMSTLDLISSLRSVSKNLALEMALKHLNWDLGANNRAIDDDVKEYLFGKVYVLAPGKQFNFHLMNYELFNWLVLTNTQYHHLVLTGFDWPVGITLIEGKIHPSWQQYHELTEGHRSAAIGAIHRESLYFYEGCSITGSSTSRNVIGIEGPKIWSYLYRKSYLERLVLDDYTETPDHNYHIEVDSLQLNGRHPGIDKIVNLSSVKQLSLMTTTANRDDGIFKHVHQLTLVTDLCVLSGSGKHGTAYGSAEYEKICAIPGPVERLVVVTDQRNPYDYTTALNMAMSFPTLVYLEVTHRVNSLSWPRVRTSEIERDKYEQEDVLVLKLPALKKIVWYENRICTDEEYTFVK